MRMYGATDGLALTGRPRRGGGGSILAARLHGRHVVGFTHGLLQHRACMLAARLDPTTPELVQALLDSPLVSAKGISRPLSNDAW